MVMHIAKFCDETFSIEYFTRFWVAIRDLKGKVLLDAPMTVPKKNFGATTCLIHINYACQLECLCDCVYVYTIHNIF